MADELDAVYRSGARTMKVVHVHKLTGVSGSENHLLALLPALRAAGIDARFLGLDVPGSTRRGSTSASTSWTSPTGGVRCGMDVSPRMARDVIRAVELERPDLLHTHLVHADVYGAIAGRRAPSAVRLDPPQRRPLPARAFPLSSTARSRGRRAG